MEHSPVPLIIFSSRRSRRDVLFLRLTWARMRGATRKAGFILGVLVWPVLVCIKAGQQSFIQGPGVSESFGIPVIRQWIEQVLFGVIYGRPPHIYYMYGLFDKKRRTHVRDYITPQEFRGLVEAAGDLATVAVMDDKLMFETACERAGLPCLKTRIIMEKGAAELATGKQCRSLPPEDLFVKPSSAHGGEGCISYTWEGGGYHGSDGSFVRSDVLFQRLCSLSFSAKLLIQPRLRNHSELEKSGLSTLSTVRVLSAIHRNGDIVILRAIFKIPTAGMVIDNLGAGGIGCPVDLYDGRLRAGYKKASPVPVEYHPETGISFQSIQIPLWEGVVELAANAHSTFPGLAFAGWDIAVTCEGPVLVEGNGFPAVESMQQAHGPLFNDEVFKSLYREIGNSSAKL